MSGSATFATARFRFATAATRISASRTRPAGAGRPPAPRRARRPAAIAGIATIAPHATARPSPRSGDRFSHAGARALEGSPSIRCPLPSRAPREAPRDPRRDIPARTSSLTRPAPDMALEPRTARSRLHVGGLSRTTTQTPRRVRDRPHGRGDDGARGTSDHLQRPVTAGLYWSYLTAAPMAIGLYWWLRRPAQPLRPAARRLRRPDVDRLVAGSGRAGDLQPGRARGGALLAADDLPLPRVPDRPHRAARRALADGRARGRGARDLPPVGVASRP